MDSILFNNRRYSGGNSIHFVHSGEEYFRTVESLIDSAVKEVHFQTYRYNGDSTGLIVLKALKRARDRGVEVFLLLDAYGSSALPATFIRDIKRFGIHIRWFSPFFTSRGIHIGRRLHHKVLVADGEKALVGGINIADRYRGVGNSIAWLDFAVLVEGSLAGELEIICKKIWDKNFKDKEALKGFREKRKTTQSLPVGVLASVSRNDWFRGKVEIAVNYTRLLKEAQHSIIILAGYYLPGKRIRLLLRRASDRGVKIKLILPGISDVIIARRAILYLYSELLKNKNIKIYEWNDSVLHGKLAIMDNKWVTIGSFNPIHLSEYSSIELNIDVLDVSFAEQVNVDLNKNVLARCREVVPEEYMEKRTFIARIGDRFAYYTLRYMMRLLFFLTSKD